MALQSWAELASLQHCSRQNTTPYLKVVVSKSPVKRQLLFRFSPALIQKLGWLQGDRLDFYFDPEQKLFLIRRVKAGGWRLQFPASGNRKWGVVALAYRPWMIDAAVCPLTVTEYLIGPEGFKFIVPMIN